MDKEFALNPMLKANETAAMWYILGLSNTANRKKEGLKLAKKTFDNLMQQKTESMFVGDFARLIDPQMGTTYDSLLNVIVQHFPKGMVSYNLKSMELQKAKDPDKILEQYAALQKEFPDKCKNSQEQLNRYLVIAYRIKKDSANFEKYLAEKKDDKWFQAEQLNEMAWELTTVNTQLSEAKQYSERSLVLMDSIAKAGKTEYDVQQEWEESVNKTKGNYYDTYANIFYNEGNKQQAAANEQKAVDLTQGKNSYMNEQLVKYLIESNQSQVALDRAEQFKIAQQSTAKLDSMFKVTYLTLHGQEALNAAKIRIASQLKDAPDFTLKTMDGKSVTLSALKGKIVILDFWATWCGPCVSSFPGMQKAMDAMKDNKDVCFYFINTFERVSPEDRLAKIKSTLEVKNVHFDVLLDSQEGDNFKVSEMYDVKNIPTKIIIDKNGKMYTKLVGYSGNNEELVKELKGVVEELK
jgi:thiol-disulfide isomerase/thioredoxin